MGLAGCRKKRQKRLQKELDHFLLFWSLCGDFLERARSLRQPIRGFPYTGYTETLTKTKQCATIAEKFSVRGYSFLVFLQNGVTGNNSPQAFPIIFGKYSYMINGFQIKIFKCNDFEKNGI